ncbi:hypothetical protein [Paraburkholderia sp. MM5482-R1]|uniref:hypothetical protein n=1 Tax=unclassified Paraburkholderia TaxID=2615204 RepID=UPI003D1FED80
MTGADKLFDRGIAIYLQFKKSQGLHPASLVKPSNRKNRSPLETIREFRVNNGLEDNPTLFFQLHKQAETANDLQHNILLAYENPPNTRGIYVAPLLLDKSTYYNTLFENSNRFLVDPFYYRLYHEVHTHRWVSRFGAVPFLREHVSIPPHERVLDHNHYYAYSETGTDISWHSPDVISRDPSRLSDFMQRTLEQCFDDPESMLSIRDLRDQIQRIAESTGFIDNTVWGDGDDMDYFRHHAKWLRENYGIRQMLLVGNSHLIDEIKRG